MFDELLLYVAHLQLFQGLTGPPDRHRRVIPAEAYVDEAHVDVSLFIDRIPNLLLEFP